MFKQRILLASFSLLTFFSSTVFAASFDCRQASRPLDKRICADAAVSQADSHLAVVYQAAMQQAADKAALITAQRAWLKARATCADAACLLQRYQGRITVLQKGLASTHPPVKPTAALSSASPAGAYPVWINPDLGVKGLTPQDIKAALARKFWDNPVYQRDFKSELVYLKANYQAQGLPTNCLDMVQLIKEKKYGGDGTAGTRLDTPGNTMNDFIAGYSPLLFRAATDCQAVRLLQRVRPAVRSAVQNFQLNNKIAEAMPALAVPNSESCLTDMDEGGNYLPSPLDSVNNQRKSWSQFYQFNHDPTIHPLSDQILFLASLPETLKFNIYSLGDSEAYAFTAMQLLARGDFMGAGQEQLLIALQERQILDSPQILDGPPGEYMTSALFLLTRTKPNQVLQLLYPQKYIDNRNGMPDCDEKLFSLVRRGDV